MLSVVPAHTAAADDPASCPFVNGPDAVVYTWDGGGSTDYWGESANWNPNGVPNDNTNGNGPVERTDTYVCIPAGAHVVIDEGPGSSYNNHYVVRAFYLADGASLNVTLGDSLAAMGSAESFAGPGSVIRVSGGTLGGEGTIRSKGLVSIESGTDGPSTLSSQAATGPLPGSLGSLVIDSGGELRFPNLGVNVQQRYQIKLQGTGRSVVSGSGAIAANYGTRFEIGPSAQLTFAGSGGYDQGNTDGFTTLSELVNAGRLVKTGGATSVIDADYSEVGNGEMVVESGTVAFPDGTTYPATVQPGQRMSTEQCAPTSAPTTGFQPCAVETNPNVDPQSISLQVPKGNPGGAFVEVREFQVAAARTARRAGAAVIFDSYAHAAGLRADRLQPAVIEMRFDGRRSDGRPLQNLAVYQDGREIQTCLGTTGAPALGQVACIDRRGRGDSTRNLGGNVYVVVRATSTSRWKIRRELEDVAAPTLFTPTKQRKGNLGSAVRVVTKCDEKCTLKGGGVIKVKGLGKLRLQKDTAKGKAGKRATLKLVLTKASARKLAQSGKKKGTATVTFKASDKAGNYVRERVKVKLR